jgi:hypothetical protein
MLDMRLDDSLMKVIVGTRNYMDARSILVEYRDKGFSAQEVYALLESIRSSLRDDGMEDKVLEIMDIAGGFCPRNLRVWEASDQE